MIASKAWFLCLVELAVEIRLGGFLWRGLCFVWTVFLES